MTFNPILMDVPMPIRTPRLIIWPKSFSDSTETVAAVRETWDDLHRWMAWAEDLESVTLEQQELRARLVTTRFELREEFNLVGFEAQTHLPVIWCGFHEIDWRARTCETGFWVRKSAQNRGFATESTNALLRYAFGALGMTQVGITHSEGNDASRRVIEKLSFTPQGVHPASNPLPGGRMVDRHTYARWNTLGLPDLQVSWGA